MCKFSYMGNWSKLVWQINQHKHNRHFLYPFKDFEHLTENNKSTSRPVIHHNRITIDLPQILTPLLSQFHIALYYTIFQEFIYLPFKYWMIKVITTSGEQNYKSTTLSEKNMFYTSQFSIIVPYLLTLSPYSILSHQWKHLNIYFVISP